MLTRSCVVSLQKRRRLAARRAWGRKRRDFGCMKYRSQKKKWPGWQCQ